MADDVEQIAPFTFRAVAMAEASATPAWTAEQSTLWRRKTLRTLDYCARNRSAWWAYQLAARSDVIWAEPLPPRGGR